MSYRRINQNELYHYGILGMRWGHRKSREEIRAERRRLEARKKKIKENKKLAKRAEKERIKAEKKAKKNRDTDALRKLSDAELREKISRLELEKKYKDLMGAVNPKRKKAGREFVTKILASSTSNIGQQLTTYAMGATINAIAGKEIVNPKKGQKDK